MGKDEVMAAFLLALEESRKRPKLLGMNLNNPAVQCPLEAALFAVKKCGPSREFSIVRTKIEEALLWLKAAERGDWPTEGASK